MLHYLRTLVRMQAANEWHCIVCGTSGFSTTAGEPPSRWRVDDEGERTGICPDERYADADDEDGWHDGSPDPRLEAGDDPYD